MDWITDYYPELKQPIEAEIEYMGEKTIVIGTYHGDGYILIPFYSGHGAALIIRWKPKLDV